MFRRGVISSANREFALANCREFNRGMSDHGTTAVGAKRSLRFCMLEPNFLLMDWTNQHCRAFPPPVSRRTPTEAVFDDNPRKHSLILAVHLWNPSGAEPTTIAEVP